METHRFTIVNRLESRPNDQHRRRTPPQKRAMIPPLQLNDYSKNDIPSTQQVVRQNTNIDDSLLQVKWLLWLFCNKTIFAIEYE